MTQKTNQFKGQKKKTIPPSRHGKAPQTRKGKKVIKPSKVTKEMDADRELTKFINYCNEVKAATVACKEGGQLSILKPRKESVRSMDSVGSQEVNQVSIVRPSTGSAGNTNTT